MPRISRKKAESPPVTNALSTTRPFLWGPSKAGPVVSETNALQQAAVIA